MAKRIDPSGPPLRERWLELMEAWPAMFAYHLRQSLPTPVQVQGIECDLGWLTLVERFLSELEERATQVQLPPPRIAQIKEKFGELRIHYVRPSTGHVRSEFLLLADKFSSESRRVCEICGEPGSYFGEPWWITRCSDHSPVPHSRSGAQ
jgi:hypothetical protein